MPADTLEHLQGHKFIHQYAGKAPVTHCRLSVLTHELLTDLSNLELSVWVTTCKTWNYGGGPFEQVWIELPYLFNWFQTLVRFKLFVVLLFSLVLGFGTTFLPFSSLDLP